MNTSLGNRDSLLLHGLVNSRLILDVHLVKLIDATDTMVCQHQSSCFNAELSSLSVLQDTGSQTCGITGLSTTVDGSWQELADILEELTLGCGWVSDDAGVDVSSQLKIVSCVLLDSTEELEEDSFLDILMTVDRWGD